jgi:hypothetical protein
MGKGCVGEKLEAALPICLLPFANLITKWKEKHR